MDNNKKVDETWAPSVLSFEPRAIGAQHITARPFGAPTMRECLREAHKTAVTVGVPVVFVYNGTEVTVEAHSDLEAVHAEWLHAACGPRPRRAGPCVPSPAPKPAAEPVTVEARIKALRTAALLVDGGAGAVVKVDYNGEGWSAVAESRHLDGVYGSGDTLDEALAKLNTFLVKLLCDVRRRGEAQLATVDAALAGLGGGL